MNKTFTRYVWSLVFVSHNLGGNKMKKTKNVIDFYLKENVLKSNYEKFEKIGQIYYPLKKELKLK